MGGGRSLCAGGFSLQLGAFKPQTLPLTSRLQNDVWETSLSLVGAHQPALGKDVALHRVDEVLLGGAGAECGLVI